MKTVNRIISLGKELINHISNNVFWLILSNLFIAMCQFAVFTLIDRQQGRELLGVWSLATAAVSIGQVSSFGFSNSLVRYVPELILKQDVAQIKLMIGTIMVSNFILSLPFILILYFPAVLYAKYLLLDFQFAIFKSVITWSMAGLFLSNLFGTYSSLLDGLQKYKKRCIIQITGWMIFVILTITLLPVYGLKGVAISFFLQNLIQLIIAAISLITDRQFPLTLNFKFNKKTFIKIYSFGAKSQAISVLAIFFDPFVKFFLTKYVNISATANYEFCNKIAIQARNLLVNANQVIITKMVLHKAQKTEKKFFEQVQQANTYFSVIVGLLVLAISPIAILIFSNSYDKDLLRGVAIINIGWVCNMIASVHYFTCIGLDKIDKLIYYHLILALIVVLLSYVLHVTKASNEVFFAVPSVALFIGSIYKSLVLLKELNNSFRWLKSSIFQYFILTSALMITLYSQKGLIMHYAILSCLITGLIFWKKQIKLAFNRKGR